MSELSLEVVEFDPSDATDKMFDIYLDIFDEWLLEINPKDKLESREARKRKIKDPNPRRGYTRWLFFNKELNSEKAVGYGILRYKTKYHPNYEEDKTIGTFYVYVLNEFRRKGIGKEILKVVTARAEKMNLTILQSPASLQSGQEFYKHFNGFVALENSENRLYLSDVDWKLMESWKKQGSILSKKESVTLQSFERVPEKMIKEFVEIYSETINQQPFGELEGRFKVTIESRRRDEEHNKKQEYIWYTITTVEKSGRISGLTEILYNLETPFRVEQLLTGVKEEFRGRGLGKWLKAEMILHIKEHFPQVEFISTGNFDTNAPMLSINNRMGFKSHISYKNYKFKLNELKKLLK
ncbi:MAG: GNAT family N-acetyltransferase [Candidatus Thorarchaeota archaeon]